MSVRLPALDAGVVMPQQRVVIAAGEEALRRELREGLAALGFITWGEASDGLAALAQVRRARPHLVVLAPPLPSVDEAQVVEAVIRGGVAPVVLLQPKVRDGERGMIWEESICARLARPFSRQSLLDSIDAARVRFARLALVRAELRRLQRDRAGRRLVELAKSLLMRRLSIGEPEAFWRIQAYCLDAEQPAHAAVDALIGASRLVVEE